MTQESHRASNPYIPASKVEQPMRPSRRMLTLECDFSLSFPTPSRPKPQGVSESPFTSGDTLTTINATNSLQLLIKLSSSFEKSSRFFNDKTSYVESCGKMALYFSFFLLKTEHPQLCIKFIVSYKF